MKSIRNFFSKGYDGVVAGIVCLTLFIYLLTQFTGPTTALEGKENPYYDFVFVATEPIMLNDAQYFEANRQECICQCHENRRDVYFKYYDLVCDTLDKEKLLEFRRTHNMSDNIPPIIMPITKRGFENFSGDKEKLLLALLRASYSSTTEEGIYNVDKVLEEYGLSDEKPRYSGEGEDAPYILILD